MSECTLDKSRNKEQSPGDNSQEEVKNQNSPEVLELGEPENEELSVLGSDFADDVEYCLVDGSQPKTHMQTKDDSDNSESDRRRPRGQRSCQEEAEAEIPAPPEKKESAAEGQSESKSEGKTKSVTQADKVKSPSGSGAEIPNAENQALYQQLAEERNKARERELDAKAEALNLKAQLLKLQSVKVKKEEESTHAESSSGDEESSSEDDESRKRKRRKKNRPGKAERDAAKQQKLAAKQAASAEPVGKSKIQALRETLSKGRGGRGGRGRGRGRGGNHAIDLEEKEEKNGVNTASEPSTSEVPIVTFTAPKQVTTTPLTPVSQQTSGDTGKVSSQTTQGTEGTSLVQPGDKEKIQSLLFKLRSDRQLRHKLAPPSTDKSTFALATNLQKEVALGLSQFRNTVNTGPARVSFHTTSEQNRFDYQTRILNYSLLALPPGLLDDSPYNWNQTVVLELCSSWLSQANLQVGILNRVLKQQGGGKYEPHVREHLIILERLVSRLRETLQEAAVPKSVSGGNRPFLGEGDISEVSNALWCGEELLISVSNLYLDSL